MLAVLALACRPDDGGPKLVDAPPDVATKPCNGFDDDRDGLVDEGNDLDGDGIPDCFDAEECDGIDNDGNGLVDDGFDSDGDGTADCFDTEECDDVDNDGDGEVDEGFPDDCNPCNGEDDNGNGVIDEGHDVDGDGVADCFDAEECDGIDNDGDGVIDEDLDHDWDGLCDGFDLEECDGWDNDGDGIIDEGFDPLGGDCWVPESCNGVDDDGDGAIDEGFADVDADGVADCLASCGQPTHYTICTYDAGNATFDCTYEAPASVNYVFQGSVADLEMFDWTTVTITASANGWSGYLWHLADSETCNGYGGDAGTSSYDSEAHSDPTGAVMVYDADLAPTTLLADVPGQLAAPDDRLFVQACQGWFAYRSQSADGPLEVSSATLFQWDGTEADQERPGGLNDTLLHLGIDRMVYDHTRNGVGLRDLVLVFGK